MDGERQGWADVACVRATGADAAAFLQSQLTNDIDAVGVGHGHWNARVSRTGHLQSLFSLHRVTDEVVWMLLPAESAAGLHADLDAFIFADKVELDIPEFEWAFVVGPAASVVLGELGLAADGEAGQLWQLDGGVLLRRSFVGDDGLIVGGAAACVQAVVQAADRAGVQIVSSESMSGVIERLRQEAGLVRPAVDLARKRLLPETGLEQVAVSYTKGCYLGQEVIARVRTYGSLPHALRALILEGGGIDDLPDVGGDVILDDGTKAGQAASRAWSVQVDGPVLWAFLKRDHRTPGHTLTLRTAAGLRTAKVALLPLYQAADRSDRVADLYDKAVRTFAEGDVDAALALLEAALRLDPEFADGYEAIGVMLGRSGRFHEAIDVFKRLEEVAPHEPIVHTNLSLYYMKLGDKETAERHAGLAARMSLSKDAGQSGKSASEVAAEADVARRADAERKARMFGQVLDFDPVDPIALFGLGTALSILGRWDDAVDALEKAQQADAKNAAVYLAHGKALERLSRDAEAVQVYRSGMEVASRRGDLMPLREMESRVLLLSGPSESES